MSGQAVSIRDESTNAMLPIISSPRGNFITIGEGSVTSGTTLSAATSGQGTAIDFGSASSSATFQVVTTAGITAGAVQFMGSIDGTTFTPLPTATSFGGAGSNANPYTLTANGSAMFHYNGLAVRYLRCDVSTTVTGGTVTVKVAAF